MNWTNTNINNDLNNLLFIQDQSLARAYTLELEEMWGSAGDTPMCNGAEAALPSGITPRTGSSSATCQWNFGFPLPTEQPVKL
jgi:hypothetical protein